MELSKDERIAVYGINYKDDPGNALRFLGALGNPFERVGADPAGRASIDWGIYGIPETFLISREGVVLYKIAGPIDAAQYEKLKVEIEKALKL